MKKLIALLPPTPQLVVLPLIMIPRVVVHDLHLLPLGSPVYMMLALIPLGVWAFVAAAWKSEHPLRDFLFFGGAYGLALGITHEILWNASFGDNVPHIGGALADKLSPFWEEVFLRKFAFVSSIGTGLVTGALFGGAALLARRMRNLGK